MLSFYNGVGDTTVSFSLDLDNIKTQCGARLICNCYFTNSGGFLTIDEKMAWLDARADEILDSCCVRSSLAGFCIITDNLYPNGSHVGPGDFRTRHFVAWLARRGFTIVQGPVVGHPGYGNNHCITSWIVANPNCVFDASAVVYNTPKKYPAVFSEEVKDFTIHALKQFVAWAAPTKANEDDGSASKDK